MFERKFDPERTKRILKKIYNILKGMEKELDHYLILLENMQEDKDMIQKLTHALQELESTEKKIYHEESRGGMKRLASEQHHQYKELEILQQYVLKLQNENVAAHTMKKLDLLAHEIADEIREIDRMEAT